MFGLSKKKEPANIKEVLDSFKELRGKVENLADGLETLKQEAKFAFQKIRIVRFNPFADVGGNQSFVIALLDANNDGMVITSLYTRDGNRVYAKQIKKGTSEHALSKEEQQAIEQAIG